MTDEILNGTSVNPPEKKAKTAVVEENEEKEELKRERRMK